MEVNIKELENCKREFEATLSLRENGEIITTTILPAINLAAGSERVIDINNYLKL